MKNFTNIIFNVCKVCYMMAVIPYEIVVVISGLVVMALMKIPKKCINSNDIDAVEGLFLAAEAIPLLIIGIEKVNLPEDMQKLAKTECIDVKGDFEKHMATFKQWLKGS